MYRTAELDLEDFVDECEPEAPVSLCFLFLLPAAVIKPAPPSLLLKSTEASSAATSELLAAQCESIKAIHVRTKLPVLKVS